MSHSKREYSFSLYQLKSQPKNQSRNQSRIQSKTLAPIIFGLMIISCLLLHKNAFAQASICESGAVETGSLTRTDFYQFLPGGQVYFAEGRQNGCVTGPQNADFQLWLYEWNADTRLWSVVRRAENPGSTESISYEAKGTYYAWLVFTTGAEGDFEFTLSDAVPSSEPACFATRAVDDSWAGQNIIGRIRPGDRGTDVAIDLRGTNIRIHDKSDDAVEDGKPVIDSRWGLVQLDSSTDLCVAGGQITSPNAHNTTWLENYDTAGIGTGYRLGTTRNHVAVDLGEAERPIVTGLYFFNLHDGVRFNSADNWRIEHSWGEYTRDDCIENDEMASGSIYDVLFDGCYSGYSNRPSGLTDDDGRPITGLDKTVTFEKVLLRMEMMPGPYKACERAHQYFDRAREPYTASSCVERDVYGNGNIFKLHNQSDNTGGINPTFNLIDSFFVVEQVQGSTGKSPADFPPESKIGLCENVTIVYLGEGPYPGRLPPEGCYTLYDQENRSIGLSLWQQKVTEWHARHPNLAKDRKEPSLYGDVTFPRPPFNESER